MIDRRRIARLVIVESLILLAIGGVATRLVYLHVGPTEVRLKAAERAGRYVRPLTVARGRILDGSRTRNVLAMNVTVDDICADPKFIHGRGKVELVAQKLTAELGMDPGFVGRQLSDTNRQFTYLRRLVPQEQADRIQALKLPGVFLQDVSARYYPHESFLCHVVGFVNREGVGSLGVEQTMNRFLAGSPGVREGRLDGKRRELYGRRVREVLPRDGADVRLSIDQNIQFFVEQALDEVMRQHAPSGACAIVQRVKTGEILAMASRPAFDPNAFTDVGDELRFMNRAIAMTYEPGSTLKPVAISLALSRGVVRPETVFDCESGGWLYQGRVLRDFHPYGNLNVADILKKSSNIGTAKIALLLGDSCLEQGLRAFGFGQTLGIDLPGEENGILHEARAWSGISCSRIAIGQGVSVTALQILGMMCAIANDGFLMKPRLVKQVVAEDGTVLREAQPEVLGRPIDDATAALMRHLLARVTEDGGTGKKARVEGIPVAGKTGTAQKVKNGVYSESAYVSSFVGFLPAEAPEFGIIVVVDEPQPYHTGGVVAAPAFARIASEAVRYLGMEPAGPDLPEGAGPVFVLNEPGPRP